MIMAMAIMDMLGAVSIPPFITVLANPRVMQANATWKISTITSPDIGIHIPGQSLFALEVLVFAMLYLAGF